MTPIARAAPHGAGLAAAARDQAVTWLLLESHMLRPEELPAATDQAARKAGAQGSRIYLISRDQRHLVPLADGSSVEDADADMLSVEGTIAGRAFRDSQVMSSIGGDRLWLPLLDGTERLGVLEVLADDEANDLEGALRPLAALVAELVVSKGQYTDSFERTRRALPMGVAAEMLWRQLPPLTFATDRFVVTAQLEPWHEVGGDAFDYSIDGDILRLAVFDGMGHGLSATLLAGVALAAYRNARRQGASLIDTARSLDEILSV